MIISDIVEAKKLHHKLSGLFKNCFIESNPIPVKAALNYLKHIENVLRLPLTASKDITLEVMKKTLNELNINY